MLALGREVERLGQHQAVVRLGGGCRLCRQAERDAVEPGIGLLAHRAAQLAERHVAGRIAAHEIDQAALVGRVAFLLRRGDREHHVAMGVVDGEHAVGAVDADLEAVDRARPGHRQRPRDVEVIDTAVGEHDHARGRVDAFVGRTQNLVDRARVALDRRLCLHVPHDDVERMGARDYHRGDRRGVVGALVVVDGDKPVHEGARGDHRHVAERAAAHFLLGAEPFAAEALGVAHHRVELGVGDRLEHARGFAEVGGERLLDQHGNAALDRAHDRIDVEMLVGGDDDAGHLRPLEQLAVVLRHEVGADLLGDIEAAVVVLLRDPDPLHRRMARRDLAAKQADPAGANDGKADVCGLPPHRFAPTISAICDSDWFESGRSTGALISAERSAAV